MKGLRIWFTTVHRQKRYYIEQCKIDSRPTVYVHAIATARKKKNENKKIDIDPFAYLTVPTPPQKKCCKLGISLISVYVLWGHNRICVRCAVWLKRKVKFSMYVLHRVLLSKRWGYERDTKSRTYKEKYLIGRFHGSLIKQSNYYV